MKKIFLLLSTGTILLTAAGCAQMANTPKSALLTPLLTAGGGAAGLYAGKDKDIGTQMAYAGGGALGGYLAGQFLEAGFKEEKAKEFRAGYDLGQSNATKNLYWNIQKLHEAQNAGNNQLIYYQLPIQYPQDGANRVPGSVMMPVVETRN